MEWGTPTTSIEEDDWFLKLYLRRYLSVYLKHTARLLKALGHESKHLELLLIQTAKQLSVLDYAGLDVGYLRGLVAEFLMMSILSALLDGSLASVMT